MRIFNAAVVSLVCAIGAAAQDKVTVPLTNPSQPVTIRAKMMRGSITVTTGSGPDVIVTTMAGSDARDRSRGDAPPPGMKRIDGGRGVNIEEDHNVVTISSGAFGGRGDLTIQAPANTSLQLTTMTGGSIDVTGTNGDHEINNMNGPIKLTNVSGSVVAHTMNGTITASLDHITNDKPMSFTSLNGRIDVTIPGDTKARLRLKTDNGSIYSDFDVKLEPDANKPVVEDSRAQGGKYKIKVDRTVTGTINGGGPEYTFQTMNGNILIHKK
jgi:hypothetical protein